MSTLAETLLAIANSSSEESTIVFLENAEREIEVGIHDFEKGVSQPVIFDLYAVQMGSNPPTNEEISEVLDYEYLIECLDHALSGNRFSLLESLANEILDLAMSPVSVIAATVKITKSDVPGVSGSLGCCVTRVK